MTEPTPESQSASPAPGSSGAARPWFRPLVIAAAAVVLLLVTVGVVWFASAGPNQEEPGPATQSFLGAYATGDPAACELATHRLRSQLEGDNRCRGQARGDTPTVRVIHATTCGSQSLVDVQVSPPGQVGAPYASIQLEQLPEGQWAVESILPVHDPQVIHQPPAPCDVDSSYGG